MPNLWTYRSVICLQTFIFNTHRRICKYRKRNNMNAISITFYKENKIDRFVKWKFISIIVKLPWNSVYFFINNINTSFKLYVVHGRQRELGNLMLKHIVHIKTVAFLILRRILKVLRVEWRNSTPRLIVTRTRKIKVLNISSPLAGIELTQTRASALRQISIFYDKHFYNCLTQVLNPRRPEATERVY